MASGRMGTQSMPHPTRSIEQGDLAGVEAFLRDGWVPRGEHIGLAICSERCSTDLLELLIQAGGDVDIQLKSGQIGNLRRMPDGGKSSRLATVPQAGEPQMITPLMHAAEQGDMEKILVLLAHGANVDATGFCSNDYIGTAADAAEIAGNKTIYGYTYNASRVRDHFAILRLLDNVNAGVAGSLEIVMYHGTHHDYADRIQSHGFTPSTGGMLGPGVYCSRDPNKAYNYGPGKHGDNGVILKLLVTVGKVHAIRQASQRNGSWQHETNADTAWVVPGVQPSGEEDCVKNLSQLRVIGFATQSDPRGHVVRESGAARGALPRQILEEKAMQARLHAQVQLNARVQHAQALRMENAYALGEYGVGNWPTKAQWERFLKTASWGELSPYGRQSLHELTVP